MIKKLQNKIEELTSKKKEINDEIKERTKILQVSLKETEDEIKYLNNEIKKINKKRVNDKSVHILERYELWRDMKHENTRWLIDRGPIRDCFFDEGDRHRTYSIIERLDDFLDEYTSYELDEDNFPDVDLEYSLLTDEGRKIFDELLDEDQKQFIINLIENAIDMNIDEFTFDW